MTTPAENTNVDHQMATVINRKLNGAPVAPINSTAFYGSTVNIRPASGTSPLRADGSRAPRAWTNRWFQSTPLNRSNRWTRKAGGSYVFTYDTPIQTVIDVTANRVFNAVGATWCHTASPTSFPYNVEAQARTNFLVEVAGGKMQLGATLGEMGQTIRLVSKLAEESLGAVISITNRYGLLKEDVARLLTGKRLRKMPPAEWYKFKKLAPAIISRWLEVQFGLRPLISDIEDGSAVLSAMIFEEQMEAILTVRKGRRVIERVTGTLTGINGDWVFYQPYLVETSCHISGTYKVPITATRTYQELGLRNSFSVAWELTQFSWMVDYILGVGDWLESMTATKGLVYLEGSISRKQEVSPGGNGTYQASDSDVALLKGFYTTMFEATGGRFEREVLLSSPLPSLVPPVRSRLGLDQMANSLAALAVFAGGGRGLR